MTGFERGLKFAREQRRRRVDCCCCLGDVGTARGGDRVQGKCMNIGVYPRVVRSTGVGWKKE